MNSIPRSAAVNETLVLTFPSRLEAFGLSQHQASTPLMDSEDDNDFDDTDVANSDSDSDYSNCTNDSSENFEEEGTRDDLVANIQSQRDQVGTKNPIVAKENRYMCKEVQVQE